MKKRGTRALISNSYEKIATKKTSWFSGPQKSKWIFAESKRSALELSIGTIVIIVLAMTMLILGIVLVRSIMCGAVGLTGEINKRVTGEINKLFEARGGEVQCVGAGEEAVIMVPGKTNIVYCSVKADKEAEYEIKVKSMTGNILKEKDLEKWVVGDNTFKKRIAPSDESAQKFLRLQIPDNAARDIVTIEIEIYKDGTLIASPTLDFEIKSAGVIRAAVC